MRNEPGSYWRLDPLPGKSIRDANTVSLLRQYILGAHIDEELFSLMQNKTSREVLISTLLTHHFSPDGQQALKQEIEVQGNAYKYSVLLEKAARTCEEALPPVESYQEAARDQGFRRVIVNCYDHRCAMCGTRIVTPEGYTAVEAAHIKPWSQFRNDQIQNGMALCRLCHWAFDGGMMSVNDDYRVIASRLLTSAPNAPGFLMTLNDRQIIGPAKEQFWPSKENLRWHRENTMLR